jgi:3-hydroxyanthranilate 3,4-dioxygenase
MPALSPLHLMGWIADNPQLFKPPVSNKEVFPESEFIFMVIRGPNARNDFHIDPGDEIFYQLRGDITVEFIDGDGKRQAAPVREGQVFLVPAGTPHCPVRPADTWGLVIERKRRPDELDRLAWFCDRCQAPLHEVAFSCENIETQLAEAIDRFNGDARLRTCRRCGAVLAVPGAPA